MTKQLDELIAQMEADAEQIKEFDDEFSKGAKFALNCQLTRVKQLRDSLTLEGSQS